MSIGSVPLAADGSNSLDRLAAHRIRGLSVVEARAYLKRAHAEAAGRRAGHADHELLDAVERLVMQMESGHIPAPVEVTS